MREAATSILRWIGRFLLEFLAWPYGGSATELVDARERDPASQQLIQSADAAIAAAKPEIAEKIVAYARDVLKDEDQRQSSVMGRAQSLFFAVALLSSLLSVGVGFLVSSRPPHPFEVAAVSLISFYLVVEIIFLMISLVRAIQGLAYQRAGSSDVSRWAGYTNVNDLHKNQAIGMLRYYRYGVDVNTWRFRCLDRALMALRNIVIGSAILILAVLVFANLPIHPTCTDRTEFRAGLHINYSVECPVAEPIRGGG
jgi:hypothetical protein